MIRPDGTPAVARELWTRLLGQVMRHATWRTLSPELDDELKALARRQFMAEASRFRGHPAEVVLTFYATRTVRGISLTPHAVLGADLATGDAVHRPRVAVACLATHPPEKFHARIYRGDVREGEPDRGRAPLHPRRASAAGDHAAAARALAPPPSAATSRCSPAGPWSAR